MKLLMFGTGGHAKTVAEAIIARGEHTIAGLVNERGDPAVFLEGIAVVASNADAMEAARRLEADGAVIALGDTDARTMLAERFGSAFVFPSIIHPAAWISPSSAIGDGTVVLAGAVVGASTRIGRHCIVNTRASVDHDCIVGDFVHVCPGVTVAGHATIGAGSWIGAGSTVVDRVRVADGSFVTAHALVKSPRDA